MLQNVYIYNPDVPVPKDVRHVEIPKGVTVIGENAFRGCSDLQSVTIPDSVTEIGDYAFSECSALQSVTIPDSVTEIGEFAFSDCSALQSVTIPDGVTEIKDYVFCRCSGLQSVTIPDGVKEIGEYAFYICSDLQSVTIPDSVTKIGRRGFAYCTGLQSVTIPNSVTDIGSCAFQSCSCLQSAVIPDSITKIEKRTFEECSGLRSVVIPGSVTDIGELAFDGCTALQSVTIQDGVTKIGDCAFRGCSALQTVTIPDSVTKIKSGAFHGCSGLRSIIIPDGVTEIDLGTFEDCSALQSVVIPDSVTKIPDSAFKRCTGLRSVTIPDGITEISDGAFKGCPGLQSLIYKGINIAPFIHIDGYGVYTFDVIKTLIACQIPLGENTVQCGISMLHWNRLAQWARDYRIFGTMRLSPDMRSANGETEERLRQCFIAQRKTRYRIPNILDKLAITVHGCQIPPERLAAVFDVRYTEALIRDGIPIVPAEACRCYYDRGTCNMLIQKDKISVMAEAISLYNRSGHQECYRHLMDFILSHPDTRIEDLQYAVDHAKEIPIGADTTLLQVRQHRAYMENLGEVNKIEVKYRKVVPGFKLSDYPCSIEPVSTTYDGMTGRVLDLSDKKDIALAAKLGELTNCCQCLGDAGETAMMHGFLNPDAGFWVIEDKNGKIKAQAEIWKTDEDTLVFDNIEFANTDNGHRAERAEQLRGVIAAWAMESGYRNIIMGCGYNELSTETMEQAPIPELRLTPEEVFALWISSDAGVSFVNVDRARQYMQTDRYDPNDFVYTDAGRRCVYIKKDGAVSDYLMQGYDRTLAEKHPASGRETEKEQENDTACK